MQKGKARLFTGYGIELVMGLLVYDDVIWHTVGAQAECACYCMPP